MNWNFVMAGTASRNGLLFAIATWLVLAWKMAGGIGGGPLAAARLPDGVARLPG
jgi:hypothetical protein